MIGQEAILHQQVADYLKLRYKGTIFHSDFAAGLRLPPWLAIRNRRLQSDRGFPDLFIAASRIGFYGLFIEIKVKSVWLKNGNLSSDPHIQEQNKMLERLRIQGYKAVFGCGFEQICKIIDDYLAPQALK